VNDINVDTRVRTATTFVGHPADATTELDPSLLGVHQVSVENPKNGRAVVADARSCVSALSIESFHELIDRDISYIQGEEIEIVIPPYAPTSEKR
jgi:hypothetical protein